MCGHEFHRKVVKCAQAIRSQLDLAEIDIVEDSAATRSGCVCEIDLPEEYLKPDICEQCKNKGLVCDYLNSDPSVKFNIVKEWLAQKRARKIRQTLVDTEEHTNVLEDFEFVENDSASSATSSDPRTPTLGARSSDAHILDLDHDSNETELTVLSPLSTFIATSIDGNRKNFGQSEPEVEDDEPDSVSKHTRSPEEVHNLKRRAAALMIKLHLLVAENKQRRAFEAKHLT